MIIAIDGPSGVGKSTVSKYCAQALAFRYISSGEYYRAITHYVVSIVATLSDHHAVISHAQRLSQTTGITHYIQHINDRALLHNLEIDRQVAIVSNIAEIRSLVNSSIKKEVADNDTIIEGRDIGTVVYPNAAVKIFLTAGFDTRIKRRERQRKDQPSTQHERTIMKLRDTVDTTRVIGSLQVAKNAQIIDTTHLTFSQVCKRVIQLIIMVGDNT